MNWLEQMNSTRLIDILSSNESEDIFSKEKEKEKEKDINMNVLDEIIQFRLLISPKDGFDTDFCGRSALYLALKFSPSPQSIRMLYEVNPSAFEKHDFFGVAPISLLYLDAYPLDSLTACLDICPEKFITPNSHNSNILKGLDELWSNRVRNQGFQICDLSQDPVLFLQWEKLICTIVKVHGLFSPVPSKAMLTDQKSFFPPESIAAIDLCNAHEISTDLTVFILKMVHIQWASSSLTISPRLLHILSCYELRNQSDEKYNRALEAIIIYRLWVSPSEAFQSDSCGRTPLYHLLSSRPTPRSIQILYEANRFALTTTDFCGMSPVKLAYFRCYPTDILQIFLDLNPEAFFIGRKRQAQFVEQSVLNQLIVKWNGLVSSKTISLESLKADPKLLDEWNRFMVTIQVGSIFFSEKLDSEALPLELHGALQLLKHPVAIPTALISFIIKMNPSQLSNAMVFKNRKILPLHYLIQEYSSSEKNGTIVATNFTFLLRTMLHLYPEGASKPLLGNECSLPLHMALKGKIKYDEGISDLIQKFPAALHTSEAKTGLAPFMIAAAGLGHDLNTVLSILRQAPSTCPQVK